MRTLLVALATGVGILSAPVARAAEPSPCETFFDHKVDTCTALATKIADAAATNADVTAKKAAVAGKQAAFDAAAADKKDAAKAELDAAKQDLATSEAKLAGSTTAQKSYDEELCDGFKLQSPEGQAGLMRHAASTSKNACDTLANIIGQARAMAQFNELPKKLTPSEQVRKRMNDAKIAATTPDSATNVNASGTSAQLEPVGTTRPIALAGGSVGLAGTESGNQAVTTITINPFALKSPNDVQAQRLLDLTFTAPVQLNGPDQKLRFFGVRLRTNAAALFDSKPLEKAEQDYIKASGGFADTVQVVLSQSDDVAQCFDTLIKKGTASTNDCGGSAEDAQVRNFRATYYEALKAARREADKYYWGLDVRLNVGHEEAVVDNGEKDVHFLVGLAGGTRLPLGDWDLELRGRAAVDHFKPDAKAVKAVTSADGAFGVVLAGAPSNEIAKQTVGFGLGLEGRYAKDPGVLAPNKYLDFRAMVVVPTQNGADLALGLRIPLHDSDTPRGTIVTVGGNLGILSPEGKSTL